MKISWAIKTTVGLLVVGALAPLTAEAAFAAPPAAASSCRLNSSVVSIFNEATQTIRFTQQPSTVVYLDVTVSKPSGEWAWDQKQYLNTSGNPKEVTYTLNKGDRLRGYGIGAACLN